MSLTAHIMLRIWHLLISNAWLPFTSFSIKAARFLIIGDRLQAVSFAYMYYNAAHVLLSKVNGENWWWRLCGILGCWRYANHKFKNVIKAVLVEPTQKRMRTNSQWFKSYMFERYEVVCERYERPSKRVTISCIIRFLYDI